MPSESRYFEPVTVPAAPKKRSVIGMGPPKVAEMIDYLYRGSKELFLGVVLGIRFAGSGLVELFVLTNKILAI